VPDCERVVAQFEAHVGRRGLAGREAPAVLRKLAAAADVDAVDRDCAPGANGASTADRPVWHLGDRLAWQPDSINETGAGW